MKKLALILAAAVTLGLAAPSFAANGATPATFAQATTVKATQPAGKTVKTNVVRQDLSARRHWHGCRTVLVKKRVHHHWVVRKVRRCH